MFDFVRKHTRVMQLVLFLLIFPSFVLFGLEGYKSFQEQGEVVAKVDGHEIKQAEWDNAHRQEVERIRQQAPNIDMKLLDSPQARYSTLERLVRDRVLAAAAADSKLGVSDQRLARELQQNQLIQAMRGADGKLDMARYRQVLSAQGMTPEAFEQGVRADLAARQVLAGLGGASLTGNAIASVGLGAFHEKREVQVARFPAQDYAARVNPTDAELEAFYKANGPLFQAPEQASIEYVMLDLESVKKTIAVNEADVKAYYEQNANRYTQPEQRRASHILLAVQKNAPAEERAKVKARAEELLAEIRKNPASFAELARKNSQDTGSAQRGGDLDFFGRGAMVKPFEDAAFALKKGEISNVVESDFGFHIIQLTDVKPGTQRSFEQVRAEIENEVKAQLAQRKYAETAEVFTNGVYEQSDSLKPVADKLNLEIRTAKVTRQPAQGAAGPLANPKFLAAVFSPDAVERKRNTEAMEVGANTLVSGRITEYTAARTRPFAEVKDEVRQRVVARQAAQAARKDGEAKLAAWKQAPASAQLPAPVVVSRGQAQDLPPQIVEGALRADPAALPNFVGVDLGDAGYAVVKVNKLLPREAPPAQQAKQESDQIMRAWAQAETLAYYAMLKDRFKVKMLAPQPAATPALPGQ